MSIVLLCKNAFYSRIIVFGSFLVDLFFTHRGCGDEVSSCTDITSYTYDVYINIGHAQDDSKYSFHYITSAMHFSSEQFVIGILFMVTHIRGPPACSCSHRGGPETLFHGMYFNNVF